MPGLMLLDIATLTDLVAVAIRLHIVLMIGFAVEAVRRDNRDTRPGGAGHHMNAITLVAPGDKARGKIRINTINDRDLRTQIGLRSPRLPVWKQVRSRTWLVSVEKGAGDSSRQTSKKL